MSTLLGFLFRLPRAVGVPIAVLGLALLALVLGLLVASLPVLLCVPVSYTHLTLPTNREV